MEPLVNNDRPDEISKLETKVLLAMLRLQKGRYPTRQTKSSGVASKQIANYLVTHYPYLDGDIESQVMTALLSCVKTGLICALSNGKFRLLKPNSKNMVSSCMTRSSHGPECTCLNLINSIRKNAHQTCCLFQANGSKLITKAAKGCDNKQPKGRKLVQKKTPNWATLKVTKQTTRRTRRSPSICVQKEIKDLSKQKDVSSTALANKNKKVQKCKYCLEKHAQPNSQGLCVKCHPPGTRYGVPYDKFSPREEVMSD